MRLAIFIFALVGAALPQQTPVPTQDPLQQHVAGVELNDQDIVDGIAMLSRSTGFGVSVEYQLGATISGAAPSVKTFTTSVGPGTVSEVLDRLCALDQTFTWVRNGNMVNVLPRALANDPNYFLNRKIDDLVFQDVHDAQKAVFKTAEQLPGTKEQVAILQPGMSLDFARPWTSTLKDVTVREVFDQIAQQFGPTYGWQFSGAQDFRMITFHEGLLPKPSRSKGKQSQNSGAK